MNKAIVSLAALILALMLLTVAVIAQPTQEFPVTVQVNTEKYYFADHTDSLTEGNWIVLYGGSQWRLPTLRATYQGVSSATYTRDGNTITINSLFTSKSITYPLTTHPTYLPGATITAVFYGKSSFAGQSVQFRLIKTGPKEVKNALNNAFKGETSAFKNLISTSRDLFQGQKTVTLNSTGDAKITFTVNNPGDYLLIVVQEQSSPYELKLYGITFIEVLEYDCSVTAPGEATLGDPIRISVSLVNAPQIAEGYRYGVALVYSGAYDLDFTLTSDGTVEGTSLKADGAAIISGTASKVFKLFGVGLDNVDKDVARERLSQAFGSNNIAIAFTDLTSSTSATLSVMTDTSMPEGTYHVLVGVWSARTGERLVAFKQLSITLMPPIPPPPPPPTPEELEAMAAEEAAETLERLATTNATQAAQLLEQISTEKAAEIVEAMAAEKAALILEQTSTQRAATILANVSTEKAVNITIGLSTPKAADVMEELPLDRAVNVTEGLIEANQERKAAEIAVTMDPVKAGSIVVAAKTQAAATLIEAMVDVNTQGAAVVVEQAFEQNPEATAEALNEVSDEALVDLILAVYALPSTPQNAAEILSAIDFEKALAVIKLAIARGLTTYVAGIFYYMADDPMLKLFEALTVEEQHSVYVVAPADLKARIPAELKPIPDIAITFKELPETINVDEVVTVTVVVSNPGRWTTPRAYVDLYADGAKVKYWPVGEVAPGKTVELTVLWSPGEAKTYTLTAKAYFLEAVEELDTANNVATATIKATAPPVPPAPPTWLVVAAVIIIIAVIAAIIVVWTRMKKRGAPTP